MHINALLTACPWCAMRRRKNVKMKMMASHFALDLNKFRNLSANLRRAARTRSWGWLWSNDLTLAFSAALCPLGTFVDGSGKWRKIAYTKQSSAHWPNVSTPSTSHTPALFFDPSLWLIFPTFFSSLSYLLSPANRNRKSISNSEKHFLRRDTIWSDCCRLNERTSSPAHQKHFQDVARHVQHIIDIYSSLIKAFYCCSRSLYKRFNDSHFHSNDIFSLHFPKLISSFALAQTEEGKKSFLFSLLIRKNMHVAQQNY